MDDHSRTHRDPAPARPPGGRVPPPPPPHLRPSAPAPIAADRAAPIPVAVVVTVRPWVDPLVDEAGHHPRSRYVETFWLGVLGPTATWLLRRLVAGLEAEPDGYRLDLGATARSMGLSYAVGRSSPFSKALQRCTMFGVTHQTSDGYAVRRRVPDVAHRHLRRLPDEVRDAHDRWQRGTVDADDLLRAHRLAVAMLESGDPPEEIEHRLVALGVDEVAAAEVADNAHRLTSPA